MTIPELIAALERAEGPSRELDRAIADACGTVGRVTLHRMGNAEERETFATYTQSLDAALTLVPEGWFWRCGRTTIYGGWAFVNRTHPDHCDPGKDEFGASKEYWKGEWTPALALCAAALKARA